MNDTNPIQNNERIIYLDILRGIAILFIFVVNILSFSGFYYLSEQTKLTFRTYYIDVAIEYLIKVFVQGKFYSIFSILFGVGFVILFNKFSNSEKQFKRLYAKRMFVLLIIGLLHLSLLWSGDILTLYALLGFILIYFRNHSDRKILTWATILIFLPVFNWLFIYLTEWHYYRILFELNRSYLANLEGLPKDIFLPYYLTQTESFTDFFKINFGNLFKRFGNFLFEGRQFKVLGFFLLGIWFGRKILNENILDNVKVLKQIAVYVFLIGIPMNIVMVHFENQRTLAWMTLNALFYSIGVTSLAIAYSALIAILLNSKSKVLNIFVSVGRMPLTNYLFQTFISIYIFYGIGLGFGTNLSVTNIMLFLLFVFLFQTLFSWIWLKIFRYGPFEWIWRLITYGKFFPIRK